MSLLPNSYILTIKNHFYLIRTLNPVDETVWLNSLRVHLFTLSQESVSIRKIPASRVCS
jgi:hypothetical protein